MLVPTCGGSEDMEQLVLEEAGVQELTIDEQEELAEREAVIERGLKTFVEVGKELLAIRDGKLYRHCGTFEKYCELRWGWSRRRAYQLIDAAEVVGNVYPGTHSGAAECPYCHQSYDRAGHICKYAPTSEKQVRALTALPPAEQPDAWNRAQEIAAETGRTAPTAEIVKRAVTEIQTVLKPSVGSARGELTEVEAQRGTERPTFNRTNDNIEWARWSWNPVTGCLHDCPYCYARDIAVRFYPQGFSPTFHEDRLPAPRHTRLPPMAATDIGEKNVFVCSMADLFGKWVPQEWIDAVLAEVRAAPQWNFLFLTKFPQRLCEIDFPQNSWVGTTVDTQARVKIAERAFVDVAAGVKFLSCEPMLERLTFGSLEMFDWLIVGGASASTRTPAYFPPDEHIQHIKQQARSCGLCIYEKTNLRAERLREYPNLPSRITTDGANPHYEA